MSKNRLRVFPLSLGCPKNLADTEHVLAILKGFGVIKDFVSSHEEADLILVNTCSFIQDAVSESIENILELAQSKDKGQRLIVMGCLPLRYGKVLEKLLPEVDNFLFHREPGPAARQIVSILGLNMDEPPPWPQRIQGNKWWQAFVKISDGCSNTCTYCMIPRIKGPLRCKPPLAICQEINLLVSLGAREITLVAQNLTAYHFDDMDLVDLLKEILASTKVEWLRLMYLYPHGITPELLHLMDEEPRICNYLDIPIQHVSPKILRAMGRHGSTRELDSVFQQIRQILPDAALRTTVMVGFPGEDHKDFQQLLDFIKRWQFQHLGCFQYSDEEEAPSYRLKDKVPESIAQERKESLLALQREISHRINRSFVGQVLDVLVDGYSEESELLLCGRSRFQAPDIDGRIYINKGQAKQGQIQQVKITEAHPYDLVGEVLTQPQ